MPKVRVLILDSGHPFVHDVIANSLAKDCALTWIDYASVRAGPTKSTLVAASLDAKQCVQWFRAHRDEFDVIIGIGSPNKPILPYFRAASPRTTKIYFPYDIVAFLPRSPFWLAEQFYERTCFTLAHKIVHKGYEDELAALPYARRIVDKPHHLYRAFIRAALVNRKTAPKLSDKDGELHLVYGGGWYYWKNKAAESFFDLYRPFVDNGVHVHVYTKTMNDAQRALLHAFDKAHPYFHFEGELTHGRLVKEYPKYDYGLNFYATNLRKHTLFDKAAFSNKLFDYLSAGLPALALDKSTAMCDFLTEANLGLRVPSEEFYANPRRVIQKLQDKRAYAGMRASIKKYLSSTRASAQFAAFVTAR